MADHDVIASPLPQLPAINEPVGNAGRPTIANLKSALSTFSSTTYTADALHRMTYNDLVHAARINGLTVTIAL